MSKSEAVARLNSLGYLTAKRPKPAQFAAALKAFQRDMGLKDDGKIGPQTERALTDPHLGFCGVHEHIRTHDGVCKWPQPQITWAITGSLKPRVSDGDQKSAYAMAWDYWMSVCGVEAKFVTNRKTANVLMGSGNTGGLGSPGNVLAWSELPCGSALQLQQSYDLAETWVISDNPQRFEIDLVRVAAHEIGHVLGIPHLSDRGALLAPMYNPQVRRPQQSDIAEAVNRYGPPKEPPPTTPSAPSGEWQDWILGIKTRSPSQGGGDFEFKLP
jgi:hypothetical protein